MKSQTQNPHERPAANETDEFKAMIENAVLVERDAKILRLTGKDPAGMLNAILTNQVPERENLGVYALLLNPKGRIQTDLRVLKDPTNDRLLVVTEPEGAEAALGILGRYAPFSRVKLEDISGSWSILGVYGPAAGRLLGIAPSQEHSSVAVESGGDRLLAAGVEVPVAGYDLLGPRDALRAVRDRLISGGAVPASRDAYETSRIEAGVPRFGVDMTPENFPAEARVLDRAVSFEKGCYPGQETVARMRYRGHPNRTLHQLAVETEVVAGAEITQGGKVVGRITSTSPHDMEGKTLALGYLSRKVDLDAPMRAGDADILSARSV